MTKTGHVGEEVVLSGVRHPLLKDVWTTMHDAHKLNEL